MKRFSLAEKMAGFGVVAALVGCSGSAVIDDPGGSVGGRGNDAGASATAGRAGGGVGGSGVGGSGVGGHSGSSSAGSPGKGGGAGAAGSGGVCVNGTKMMADCNGCECIGGQWACTTIACPVKACGGFIGSTCSATEYCAYMPGDACGAADASSTCQPRPDGCTDIYMPVCGCDRETYSSTCDAALHGQGVYTEGVCPPQAE